APRAAANNPTTVEAIPSRTAVHSSATNLNTDQTAQSRAIQAGLVNASTRSPGFQTGPSPWWMFETTRRSMKASSVTHRLCQAMATSAATGTAQTTAVRYVRLARLELPKDPAGVLEDPFGGIALGVGEHEPDGLVGERREHTGRELGVRRLAAGAEARADRLGELRDHRGPPPFDVLAQDVGGALGRHQHEPPRDGVGLSRAQVAAKGRQQAVAGIAGAQVVREDCRHVRG